MSNNPPWTKTNDGFCIEVSELRSYPNLKVDGKLINMKDWRPHRDSECEIMYWTYIERGPGIRTTTYTIFND